MSTNLLRLPKLDAGSVLARQRLGRGLALAFEVNGVAGELLLEPGPAPQSAAWSSFESARGVLTISEPSAVLSLFGDCPVALMQSEAADAPWFWELFQQMLSPALRDVFGYLHPLSQLKKSAFTCRLSVVLGQSRVVAKINLAPQSLLALVDAGPWQAVKGGLPQTFALSLPVSLGSLQLDIGQLRALRDGDVVLLEQLLFNGDGAGGLRMGQAWLQARLEEREGYLCMTVVSIEESAVDDDFYTDSFEGGEQPSFDEQDDGGFETASFDELPLTLSVRCGTLKLTLGELQQLTPGSVVRLDGYAPGMAGLYYGDRAIGQGQLVEVDGRLGLQLSRVVFSR